MDLSMPLKTSLALILMVCISEGDLTHTHTHNHANTHTHTHTHTLYILPPYTVRCGLCYTQVPTGIMVGDCGTVAMATFFFQLTAFFFSNTSWKEEVERENDRHCGNILKDVPSLYSQSLRG